MPGALLAVFLYSVQTVVAQVELQVDVANPSHAISPLLIGIFLEDINFGADGGLNAELVKNGSFEFPHSLMGWSTEEADDETFQVVHDAPWRASNPNYLRIRSTRRSASPGIVNEGFRGMGIREGETYRFSAWARSGPHDARNVRIRLVDESGETVAEGEVAVTGSEWQKLSADLRPSETLNKANLEIALTDRGFVDLDMVSLYPEATWKGRPHGLRADIVELLADLKPAFFRFPGGCIVEGSALKYRYQWKTTIGDRADRRLLLNRWNREFRHRLTPDYFQSFAVGFFEYFQLAEDLGAEPMPILNCGMACQFNTSEFVPLEELEPYIQDALDLIEFANGSVDSEWGAKRAAMGHPEPFNMKMLGIGNEQWGPEYIARYKKFHEVLKEKHPEIELISGSGPFPSDQHYHYAWPELRALGTDVVDEHCYAMPDWFLKAAHRYDGFDRNGPEVFMGEYSAQTVDITSPDNRNNLQGALAEAAFMTGMERNSDIVTMSSYAPLLAHEDAWQWRPNLIWFDNLKAYATPNYYAQQLFSLHRGDEALPVELNDSRPKEEAHGRIGLATYQTSAEFKDIEVRRNGETLFTGDEIADLENVTKFHGNWSVENGVFKQSDRRGSGRVLFGDESWSNYTLTLKARKLSGREGFIVIFRNSEGGSYLEWNIGGWNNEQHGINGHLASHSTDTNILTQAEGSVEADEWYEVKIELDGSQVTCSLDGEEVHSLEIPPPPVERVYASASRDEHSGEVILKVVNVDEEAAATTIDFGSDAADTWQGEQIVLCGDPADENSISEPDKVQPKTTTIESLSLDEPYTFPPHSLTVLRLSPKN